MTTPETAALNVGTLVQDVKNSLAALDTALALVDKFTAFLPEQYRAPLEDLKKVLDTVDGFLAKV